MTDNSQTGNRIEALAETARRGTAPQDLTTVCIPSTKDGWHLRLR